MLEILRTYLFCKFFFPPNFLFAQKNFPLPKYQKKKTFWREKNNLAKKVGP
jgi:hypothetical protein